MAKKLRLAVAGLTDVGRRRERNQDNLTHFVPDADDVLEEKGALFVVCDGMGGHAAGEVASELGANSLREVYYEGHDSDIISGIANAIRSANEAIYSFAREHVEMTGMGTTCVALVIHGGRAFFVNIGDSRAYIIRDGTMRQVTLDHSWVAEQVRAGVLTEEQARTHAHRNVITRSLGTQPTVSADLFIETLRDGDRVLLCSDGLHGYVEESEIERVMVGHEDPEAGAQQLIDMANANGGPDNITALIVQLLEVPEVTGEVTLPLDPGEQPQIITQPLPAVSGAQPLAPAAEAARKRRRGNQRTRGGRVAATALRLLAVAAVLLIAAGIWDVRFGPYARAQEATARLQSDVTAMQQAAVMQASGQQDPAQALTALALAQQRVQADLRNPYVDPQVAQNARAALTTQLVPAVQNAVQSYNRTALVTALADNTATRYDVTCAAPTQTTATTPANLTSLAALPVTKSGTQAAQPFYATSAGVLYQVTVPLDATGAPQTGHVSCAPVTLPSPTTILAVVVDGTSVYALSGDSGHIQVLAIYPGASSTPDAPTAKVQPLLSVATPRGESPMLLAVQGMNVYVGYRAGSQGTAGIWMYAGSPPPADAITPTPSADATPAPTMVFDPAKSPMQVDLSSSPLSLVATNNTVYVLLGDGTVGQVTSGQKYQGLPVQVLSPVAPEAASSYSAATPVPTVAGTSKDGATPQATATPGGNTLFGPAASLALDPAHSAHVLVSDGANARVVRFSASPSGAGLGLVAQYAYSSQAPGFTQVAIASGGKALYGWNGKQLVAYPLPDATK